MPQNRKLLTKISIDEVSLCDVGAGLGTKILLRKCAGAAFDALVKAHKRRVDKAFMKSLGDPDAFLNRLAKLRARFDHELSIAKRELERLNTEASAPAQRQRDEGVVAESAGEDLVQADGYADREQRCRDIDQSSPKTRVPEQGQVAGFKGESDRLSPRRRQAIERMEEQARLRKRVDETHEQAFTRFIASDPLGREMFAKYRQSQLMDVLKSIGSAPGGGDAADDDDDDGTDPEAAMEQCEKRVSELVARGASAAAAWDEVSVSPIFKCAKRLTVRRVAM
jgi:hypothetical protein